jgi:hypothetical protein
MLEHFAGTANVVTAEVTAKTCLMIPDAVPDIQPVLALAELVSAGLEQGGDPGWNCVLGALVAYRTGDAAAAIEHLNRVPAPIEPDPGCFEGHVYSLRALAHLRLDQTKEAATCLLKAKECLSKWPDLERGERFDIGGKGDWLRFRILFDEANREIQSSESTPAALPVD